jgi:hypothetical protein
MVRFVVSLSLILFNEIIDECTTEMENWIYYNTKKSETYTGIGLVPLHQLSTF